MNYSFAGNISSLVAGRPLPQSGFDGSTTADTQTGFSTSSTTSHAIPSSPTTLTFTVADVITVATGEFVEVIYDGLDLMRGNVVSYNSGTGALTISVTQYTGSGTHTLWTVQSYGYTLKPIANWEEPPYQPFSGTHSFTCVALHKSDYTTRMKVRFSVDGGPWFSREKVVITPGQPSTQPRDISVTLNANDFTPGPHTLRAEAYPTKGPSVVLSDLVFIAQPSGNSGRYYPVYAYVSASSGNNGTGQASPTWATALAHPFADIGSAGVAIQAYRNSNFSQNNADFGVIRLSPELNVWKGPGTRWVVSDQTWVTIEALPGHGPTDTSIDYFDGSTNILCNRLHLRNIKVLTTLNSYINNSDPASDAQDHLIWVDGLTVIGRGLGYLEDDSSPVGANWDTAYMTFCDFSQCDRHLNLGQIALMRGNYIHDVSDDFVVNVPVAVHNTADNLNPYVPNLSPNKTLSTPSTTSNAIAANTTNQTYFIAPGLTTVDEFDFFEVKHDANNLMYAQGIAYNSGTGQLDVQVTGQKGSGTYTSWTITQLVSSHADGIQTYGGTGENYIWYDLVATNLNYQAMFVADDASRTPDIANIRHGLAVVDVAVSGRNPIDTTRPWSGWSMMVRHLLWWNTTEDARVCGIYHETGVDPTITDFSVRGCKFHNFEPLDVANVDMSDWDSNLFELVLGDPGAGANTSGLIGTNAGRWVR